MSGAGSTVEGDTALVEWKDGFYGEGNVTPDDRWKLWPLRLPRSYWQLRFLSSTSEGAPSDLTLGCHRAFVVLDAPGGAVVVSLCEEGRFYRVLYRTLLQPGRTGKGVERFVVAKHLVRIAWWRRLLGLRPTLSDIVRVVDEERGDALMTCNCFELGAEHSDLWKCFGDLDMPRYAAEQQKYKFGLMYAKEGQVTEDSMFRNNEADVSEQFQEFVDFLGETVTLEGWTKFDGGLDTKRNMTGLKSVYTTWNQREVMFHVSHMLANVDTGEQMLERKKFIGNDRVVLLFKEGVDDRLGADIVRSNQNHVYIVVQPFYDEAVQHTQYRVAVVCKYSVPEFEPHLVEPPIFSLDNEFRNWLFGKLTSATRAASYADEYDMLMLFHQQQKLREITGKVEKLQQK